MKRILLFAFLFGMLFNVSAQNSSAYWTQIGLDEVALPEDTEREFEPYKYQAFTLDYQGLKSKLSTAPLEFTDEGDSRPLRVMLPGKDGTLEPYHLVYSPLLTERVANKYPDIRSFKGYAVNNPAKVIRCSYSPYRGFRAFIRRDDYGVEYIQPIAPGQDEFYMVYDRKAFPNSLRPNVKTLVDIPPGFQTEAEKHSLGEPTPEDRSPVLEDEVTLKVYRFACATTGEFSQDHGGTTASVLATMVDYTNQLNVIYETDLAIRLTIVDGIENILFLDPATDPYTGTTVQNWLGQNPAAMILHLGSADQYDIGHVFARYIQGAGGVASLNSCCTQFKGRGCSAGNIPYGDGFFAIVGQEIGHQWNGLHTWNKCGSTTEPFPDIERCEPGSGSTIMSYGGGCGSDNVQNGSDLYYQVCSIFGIRKFIDEGTGSTCGTNIASGNSRPVVTIPLEDNFFIPYRTPFELDGDVVDPDGDDMSYNWDEIDLGPSSNLGSPIGNAPAFRSLPPSDKTKRSFPRLQTILNNTASNTEVLPQISRDLTFCLVARDNNTDGGGVSYDTVAFRATDQAGPFRVTTFGSSGNTWVKGSFQEVTWDVANTDVPPVNCQKVNILLSTNFGFDFNYTLATDVPNIGRACIQVPDVLGNNCRIKVEAADNIFFDINDANFTLVDPSTPDFSFCTPEITSRVCLPDDLVLPVETASLASFDTPVNFTVTGVPAGVTASFSQNPVNPGETSNLVLEFPDGFGEGEYSITIQGEAGGDMKDLEVLFTVVSNDFSALAQIAPVNGSSGVSQVPLLEWVDVVDANYYEVEVATSPTFDPVTLVATNSFVQADSFLVPVFLEKGSIYYWRVRPVNECGAGEWQAPFGFATLVDACGTYTSNDLPTNISSNNITTVTAEINIPGGGNISDINITKFKGTHNFFKDLTGRLVGPGGESVLLFDDRCPQTASFDFGFDDDAPTFFNCPPPDDQQLYRPLEDLALFNNTISTGTWTLEVTDNEFGSGGSLDEFELEICSSVALNPPFVVTNNTLSVSNGSNAVITNGFLMTEDADNDPDELVYTLMTVPQFGHLERYWTGPMQVGDKFTQEDIDNGGLRFFDYAQSSSDAFRFSVTDGNGGFAAGTFNIMSDPLSANELDVALDFAVYPNPAHDRINVVLGLEAPEALQVQLFDISGRRLRSWRITKGQTRLEVNVGELPPGVYALSATGSNGSQTRKLILH